MPTPDPQPKGSDQAIARTGVQQFGMDLIEEQEDNRAVLLGVTEMSEWIEDSNGMCSSRAAS